MSTRDILSVNRKICLALENDKRETKARISSEKIKVPYKCNIPFFREVVTHLVVFEMIKNYTMSQTGNGTFKATMGLSCARMMSGWKWQVIPIQEIHSQWRIDIRNSLFTDMRTTVSLTLIGCLPCEE